MIRIIGGTARGRRLKTPTGEATRPTADRVREALFSSLESELGSLTGLRFLDLYAGSGAIGLEAMSRGAGVVTAVESNRRTARLVQDNAAKLGFRNVEVVVQPVVRALGFLPRAPYDVVYADPPYPVDNEEVERALALLVAHDWLAVGSVLVVERSARSVEPIWPAGLVREREKTYGETVLWYVRADPAGSGAKGPTGQLAGEPDTATQGTTQSTTHTATQQTTQDPHTVTQTTSQGDPR